MHSKTKTPFYSAWWFLVICLLAVLYASSIVLIPVLDKDLKGKFSAPEKVTYTWTDESGVEHYSDIKPNVPADRIKAEPIMRKPSTVDRIEKTTLHTARKAKPILGPVLLMVMAAVVVLKGLKGTAGLIKTTRARLGRRSFERAMGKCVKMTDDFAAILKSGRIGKDNYATELGNIRAALEKLSARPLALDYQYRTVVEHLRLAFETYVDCLSLWDVESQRDIVMGKMNVFINKYPTLIDKTTGIKGPLPVAELRQAARATLWEYAEGYVVQAGRLYGRLISPEGPDEPK